MAADVWRAEVSWDAATILGPSLTTDPLIGHAAENYFLAIDDNGSYSISTGVFPAGADAEYRAFVTFRAGGPPGALGDPAGVAFHSTVQEAAGSNGGGYFGGGTLAIEKDVPAGELRLTSPIASLTLSLAALGADDNSPLRANTMGHQFNRSRDGADGNEVSKWFDFYSSKNGETFMGAALSSTDPGVWGGFIPTTYDLVGLPSGGSLCVTENAQEATRYRTKFRYTVATDVPPARSAGNREWRIWGGGDYTAQGLDLTRAPEHGIIWGAYMTGYPPIDRVRWRRTFNKGEQWQTGTIYQDSGTDNRNPNISWTVGRLVAVWHNGTDILQSFSVDLGQSWSMPTTLAITGTNPEHLVDPLTGFGFYFYFDGADLKMKRSADFGQSFIDAAAITVAAGAGAQAIGAQFGPDGSLLVGYFAVGAWTQLRSTDLGRTWS